MGACTVSSFSLMSHIRSRWEGHLSVQCNNRLQLCVLYERCVNAINKCFKNLVNMPNC